MKRALLLVLALLASVPRLAASETHDVLVLYPARNTGAVSGVPADDQYNFTIKNKLRALTDLLDQAGTDYVVVRANQVKTEWVRTGTMLKADGSALSFRSVIGSSWGMGGTQYTAVTGVAGRLRTDSLFRVARGGMQIPSLWIMDNAADIIIANAANTDSAGISGSMIVSETFYDMLQSTTTPGLAWWGASYVSNRIANHNAAGGVRSLLNLRASMQNVRYWTPPTRNAFNVDSSAYTGSGLGVDTTVVWDRLWNIATLPTAKIACFAKIAGVGYNIDSVNVDTNRNNDTEGDYTVLLYALAHFDSVSAQYQSDGKGLVFKNLRRPFRIAPVVYGLGTRNLRRFSRGILPSDTSTAYATMDSIRAMGMKITYAVDPDSAATYLRDIYKARENGAARFTPQSWTTFGQTGLDSTNIGVNASIAHPVDVFGHFRNRAFYGDSTTHYVAGSDSSITQQLLWQRTLLATYVGQQRLSTCAVAPFDDYSPLTMAITGAKGSAAYADSLILALQRAHYTHLLSNVRYRTGDPNYHPAGSLPLTNPWGWFMQQGPRYNPLTGQRFMIVGHNAEPLLQGERQQITWADSSAAGSVYNTFQMPRTVGGVLFQRVPGDIDQYQEPNNANWTAPVADANWYTDGWTGTRIDAEEWNTKPQHASVMALSFASISGDPNSPARSGYWKLKWLNSWIRTVNSAVGTEHAPIIVWAYPEEIDR